MQTAAAHQTCVQVALAERVARFGTFRLTIADDRAELSSGMASLLGGYDFAALLTQAVEGEGRSLAEIIQDALIARASLRGRVRISQKVIDTHGEVETDDNGRPIAVIGVCQDVTAQVAAEAEREKAQHIYRAMAQEASDIVMFHGTNGIYFASNALQRLMNRSPHEIEDGNYLKWVHPDDMQEAMKLRGRPGPGETWTATYRGLHGDGHYVWLEARTRGAYDERGEFLYEISVTRDVTERKEHELKIRAAQERAEAASKAKSLFLANMSHELRTPLNAIIGFADLMRLEAFGALGHARYGEYANDIRNSGQLLLDVISSVLDISKIEAGKFELSFEPVDLNAIVCDCAHMMALQADVAGLTLARALGQGGNLLADRRALKQILLNLLSNAMKFTPKGGSITVETSYAPNGAKLLVKDTGIGIQAEHIGRLGRPFEQVCVDPLLAKGGAGLGLALVRALAREHGGEMAIESTVGIGTTVTVTLPSDPARQAAA